jgi:hypothetical protein
MKGLRPLLLQKINIRLPGVDVMQLRIHRHLPEVDRLEAHSHRHGSRVSRKQRSPSLVSRARYQTPATTQGTHGDAQSLRVGARISLLERLIQHARTTADFAVN